MPEWSGVLLVMVRSRLSLLQCTARTSCCERYGLGQVIFSCGFCMGRLACSGATPRIPVGQLGLGCLGFLGEVVLYLKDGSNSSLLWVMWLC